MLKYVDSKVTFSEVPDEISLCINFSNCPHKCKGCHSEYLQKDIGEELNSVTLEEMANENNGITCVCFMGGDCDIPYLTYLANFVKSTLHLKTAWYTGLVFNPSSAGHIEVSKVFDYIKTGPYIKEFGPLTNKKTNQRFYKKKNTFEWEDITYKFWKK